MKLEDLFIPRDKTFCGHRLAQTWSALYVLENILLENLDITKIIELGTGYGGLSLFFGFHLSSTRKDCEVLTFDIKRFMNKSWFKWAKLFNVQFYEQDVFKSETIRQIEEVIIKEHALIFCDNGNKISEIALYTPILKKNDLIMVHDWGSEINKQDITSKTLNMLEPYRQEEFDNLKTMILSMRKTVKRGI